MASAPGGVAGERIGQMATDDLMHLKLKEAEEQRKQFEERYQMEPPEFP
jgi:hypothetical protein